jgi:hypothetical protein
VHERCFDSRATLVEKFEHDGVEGVVNVWYGANTSPIDTGFAAIRDIGAGPQVRGFPVIKAEVKTSGHGYANVYGWIQVISHLRSDGSVEDWSPDSIPALRDRGVPFCVLGYHPTFWDAPFWPGRPRLHWRAELFLCPMVVRRPTEEEVVSVAGVRWGFTIAREGADPKLLPVESVGGDAWRDAAPRLRDWFPGWRFGVRPRDTSRA